MYSACSDQFKLAGFPHSEISGSRVVCTSPELIAAYHVLHRLHAPRHPPCALSSLTIEFAHRKLDQHIVLLRLVLSNTQIVFGRSKVSRRYFLSLGILPIRLSKSTYNINACHPKRLTSEKLLKRTVHQTARLAKGSPWRA
jgi:hypothetical protein